MCGIAGVARLSAATNMSETDLAATVCAMTRPLAHRGPDDAGTWLDESAGIGLGHRRLSRRRPLARRAVSRCIRLMRRL